MFTVIPPSSPASHSVRAGPTPGLSSPAHYSPGLPLRQFRITFVFMCLRYFRLFYITCFTLPEIESEQNKPSHFAS